ncbi:hypothetical protein [Hyalangium rubrum]|uniref:Uncharacterized protein n=1 Tax=Hyalangium rubrum TaxID=3103134 RepID=A0ABU5H869_9BACT|nr:hypothetical protein [Hyalangium sp. s54d21]MDY7229048.1 hypothetical protein [Hyalangium sp. s54d21]
MASFIEGSGIQGSSYVNKPGLGGDISGQAGTGAGIAQAGKEQVKRLGGVTRERVYHQVDDKKEEFIKSLHGIADSLQGVGKEGNLGAVQPLVESAVQVIHKVSDRLEKGSTEELIRDAQTQIRQRPGLFIAGCVAIGFLAGRVLKI